MSVGDATVADRLDRLGFEVTPEKRPDGSMDERREQSSEGVDGPRSCRLLAQGQQRKQAEAG